jgi:hypothetical protein
LRPVKPHDIFAAILAADAELKRLREAVEWACANAPIVVNRLPGHTQFVTELRRKAKEG